MTIVTFPKGGQKEKLGGGRLGSARLDRHFAIIIKTTLKDLDMLASERTLDADEVKSVYTEQPLSMREPDTAMGRS